MVINDSGSRTRSSSFKAMPSDLTLSLSSKSNSRQTVSTPLRHYFSRRRFSRHHVQHTQSYTPEGFIGMYSIWAWLWGGTFLVVPLSYVIIGLVCLRELMARFVAMEEFVAKYLPPLYKVIHVLRMLRHRVHGGSSGSSYLVFNTATSFLARMIEYWCWLEGLFYIVFSLYVRYLQRKDPLEASLSAAPLMDEATRNLLWRRMMECESVIEGDDDNHNNGFEMKMGSNVAVAAIDKNKPDPVSWLSGWFFDEPIENISKYDIRDFVAWSMFEGRHQEHLTTAELDQLEDFVTQAEIRISLHLYGRADSSYIFGKKDNAHDIEAENISVGDDDALAANLAFRYGLPTPKHLFRFADESHHDESNFFSNLYETYKNHYEQMLNKAPEFKSVQDLRELVKNAELHPVQSFRNLMAETAQQLSHAEETAKATASQVYETLVPSGSQMDKQLSAMSHATYLQLTEAWNSVKNIQQRLETARFLSRQRQRLRQQLRGYRVMLNRMRDMSSAVPSKQMAAMMRRITECNEALEVLESRAQLAFVQATGFARKNLAFLKKEPRHYAKYSSDPLLGIAMYPLGFNLLLYGMTEGPLRISMRSRKFERRTVGDVAYYFHPGRAAIEAENTEMLYSINMDDEDDLLTPIIFVHGIGIGLIAYLPLIDALLATGRPIFLPEIPYITGFRPWQSTTALPPASVASAMTAMLACHGHMRGVWVGHSYGTSWLSYMIKYAPHTVLGVCFLDPICFCLHIPRLTKGFVYTKPDPGTASYIVRTDVIVNWTIQRSFPWAWIIVFLEEISMPCSVFLSEKDALVPSEKVAQYFERHAVPIQDFQNVVVENEEELMLATNLISDTNNPSNQSRSSSQQQKAIETKQNHPLVDCTVFRGDGHGAWTERQHQTVPAIVKAVNGLLLRSESERND